MRVSSRPMHAIADPCPSCGGFTIQPSRWRAYDISALLRLLRCHSCGDRFYISMFSRSESVPQKTDTEMVVRIRVKNPGRILRALLSWAAEPPPQSD